MSIKLKNLNIIESQITSFRLDKYAEKDDYECYDITVGLTSGKSETVSAYYNVSETAKINNRPAKDWITSHHWLTTEEEVNKIIKQLENYSKRYKIMVVLLTPLVLCVYILFLPYLVFLALCNIIKGLACDGLFKTITKLKNK